LSCPKGYDGFGFIQMCIVINGILQ
jgi:hypothetical protein